jgi:hypothetical protein
MPKLFVVGDSFVAPPNDDLAHRELNMAVVQYNRQQRDNKSKSWIGKLKRA